ncbi:MAG: hypothetical protein ABEJ70_02675 [Halobacteriaceae archaeon]
MADAEDVLAESPVGFTDAVAYALHPTMRRLIILYLVGSLLLSVGVSMLVSTGFAPFLVRVVRWVVALALVVGGATFLFGGVVGAAFKLVTDANLLAARTSTAGSE